MRTISKYPLKICGNEHTLKIPHAAHILSAQVREGMVFAWIEVETLNTLVSLKFYTYDTGQRIDVHRYDRTYVATV